MDTDSSNSRPTEDAKSADPNRPSTGTADAGRVEVSAATVTRMMGIASATDMKLLEGRIDLLGAKLSQITSKVERIASTLSSAPTGSDIDRLEIQLGSIKAMVKEVLEAVVENEGSASEKGAAQEQSRKLRQGIKTSEQGGE